MSSNVIVLNMRISTGRHKYTDKGVLNREGISNVHCAKGQQFSIYTEVSKSAVIYNYDYKVCETGISVDKYIHGTPH